MVWFGLFILFTSAVFLTVLLQKVVENSEIVTSTLKSLALTLCGSPLKDSVQCATERGAIFKTQKSPCYVINYPKLQLDQSQNEEHETKDVKP